MHSVDHIPIFSAIKKIIKFQMCGVPSPNELKLVPNGRLGALSHWGHVH